MDGSAYGWTYWMLLVYIDVHIHAEDKHRIHGLLAYRRANNNHNRAIQYIFAIGSLFAYMRLKRWCNLQY